MLKGSNPEAIILAPDLIPFLKKSSFFFFLTHSNFDYIPRRYEDLNLFLK